MKRIGITQRVCIAEDTKEKRDCLAHDWYKFLNALGVCFIPIPNDASAVNVCRQFGIEGVILSGGDDIGRFPERDVTEFAVLEWCRESSIPAIGVCRGFQVINAFWGGEAVAAEQSLHRAKRHYVRFSDDTVRSVNSYHNFAITSFSGQCGQALSPLAVCVQDQSIEAAFGLNMLGMMWHPEREKVPVSADLDIFKQYLRI